MTVHLVVNPAAAAGRASSRSDEVHQALAAHGVVELHKPATASDSSELMRSLAAAGAERVVAFGGDGMAHLAANALAGSDTVLGIVSGGTGNDTVKSLGLPTKMAPACQAALGEGRAIDLIESDTGVAFTVAIVGFAVDVNERADRMRFPKGSLKYTFATLAELPKLQAHEITVTIDGVAHDVAPNMLAVANLAYFGGGMKVAPNANPNDGLLEVVVMGPVSRPSFAMLLPTIFSGRHVKSRHVTVLQGREITVKGPALSMRADGEPWGALPITLRARPDAIRIAGI